MPLNNNLLSNDLSDDEEKGVVKTQEPSDVINAIKRCSSTKSKRSCSNQI